MVRCSVAGGGVEARRSGGLRESCEVSAYGMSVVGGRRAPKARTADFASGFASAPEFSGESGYFHCRVRVATCKLVRSRPPQGPVHPATLPEASCFAVPSSLCSFSRLS